MDMGWVPASILGMLALTVSFPFKSVYIFAESAIRSGPIVSEFTWINELKSIPVMVTAVPGSPELGLIDTDGFTIECLAMGCKDAPDMIALTTLSVEGMVTLAGTLNVVVNPPVESGYAVATCS